MDEIDRIWLAFRDRVEYALRGALDERPTRKGMVASMAVAVRFGMNVDEWSRLSALYLGIPERLLWRGRGWIPKEWMRLERSRE